MHAQLLWIVSPIGHDALEDRMIEEIRSRSNQWIKKALQLKQRKYRQAYGMFLMEGLRSVEDALRQGMKACTCFFTENQLENERFKALMKEGEALSWRFLKLNEELMKLISGTQHGQGIMLLASKEKRDIEELMHPLEGYYVLLDAVQDRQYGDDPSKCGGSRCQGSPSYERMHRSLCGKSGAKLHGEHPARPCL